MNQVKHFTAFVLGAGYLGCFWWWDWLNRTILDEGERLNLISFPLTAIVFGGFVFAVLIIAFFVNNWYKE